MKPLNEQITEIQDLMEKISTDSKGAVTGVQMNKDCPSAVRERLQIAADTAQMNEKNLRARQEALKGQIEAAEKGGDAAGAAKMRGEYDRLSGHRKTNLENMDRLESITSDYAVKHKPSDNNYDQRAHAIFLQKQREKMEARMKEEEDSSFPNPDTIGKLQRRISRVDTAQKESEKWLSEKDPKWLKAHKEASVDPKEAVKKHKESISAERKAVADAQKEAEKAVANGEAPAQGAATAAAPKEKGAERVQHTPGTTWQTSRGTFGAMNKGGIQKYFGSEEEAKIYASLEKGSRRSGENRKRKTAVSAEKKASASGVAKDIVRKKLEVAASSKSKTATDNAPKRSKPAPTFGKKRGGGFGKTKPRTKPVSKAWKPGKDTTRKVTTKDSFAADLVGKHLQKLNERQEMKEAVSLETMQQGITDCIAEIEKHKKLAHAAKTAGDTKQYKHCRNIIASRSADIKTIQDMIKREKRKSSPMQETVSSIISNSLRRKSELAEEKEKPYKGFVKGKNHPEGGLSRAEAKRQGIHAGIETKDEAERKGGFSELSPETQKRRHSFCSRMCGMKAKNTSAETARDPDSKINAALRVWGCRC